jgi:hypothetical protein
VLNRSVTYAKKLGVKLDNKHWYDHVPNSFETSHEPKVQTDRTVPNNKPGIILRDDKQGICMLINVTIPGDRNVIKKEDGKILKYNDPITRNSEHVECESDSDTSNNRGNWNHFKIPQTIPEQHTRKARN